MSTRKTVETFFSPVYFRGKYDPELVNKSVVIRRDGKCAVENCSHSGTSGIWYSNSGYPVCDMHDKMIWEKNKNTYDRTSNRD